MQNLITSRIRLLLATIAIFEQETIKLIKNLVKNAIVLDDASCIVRPIINILRNYVYTIFSILQNKTI